MYKYMLLVIAAIFLSTSLASARDYVIGDGVCGLSGIPEDPNGVFTGPGITDNGDGTAMYDPIVVGLNVITYTYTTADGCVYSTSQSTMVNPLPAIFKSI